MKKPPLANRHPELTIFAQMVAGETSKGILLIEAESGLGKTDLLAQFALNCPHDVCFISIDLKAAQTGIPYVFWRVREELRQETFPRFTAAVEQLVRVTNVNIEKNWVLGQLDIQIAMSRDEQTRGFRLIALQEAFFEDLRATNRRLVIVLDTFNAAAVELEGWIGGAFLAAAARTAGLVVVVAGQNVPATNIEWIDSYEHRKLEGIHDVDEWHTSMEAVGLVLEKNVIHAFTEVFDGHPLKIMSAFEKLAKEKGL